MSFCPMLKPANISLCKYFADIFFWPEILVEFSLRFYQLQITWLRYLSSILPLFLRPWYRQQPHLYREDFRSAIMTSWDTWRVPAKWGIRSTNRSIFLTIYNEIFSLLTWLGTPKFYFYEAKQIFYELILVRFEW